LGKTPPVGITPLVVIKGGATPGLSPQRESGVGGGGGGLAKPGFAFGGRGTGGAGHFVSKGWFLAEGKTMGPFPQGAAKRFSPTIVGLPSEGSFRLGVIRAAGAGGARGWRALTKKVGSVGCSFTGGRWGWPFLFRGPQAGGHTKVTRVTGEAKNKLFPWGGGGGPRAGRRRKRGGHPSICWNSCPGGRGGGKFTGAFRGGGFCPRDNLRGVCGRGGRWGGTWVPRHLLDEKGGFDFGHYIGKGGTRFGAASACGPF